MAIVTTDNKHYADIAAAIREKTGTMTTYKPEQMAEGIGAVYAAGKAAGGGGIDTSGATATAADIAKGKIAFANGVKIVGTLEISVFGISIVDSIFVTANGTAVIVPIITPANATNQNIIWESSDESVATVSDGVVAWVGYGDCVITAITEDGGYSASCEVTCEALRSDIMSYFKWLGPTTYSPGTYTAWCPTGLIYDESRDVYAHFMNVQNRHYMTPNACELWFNTIDPETLEHTEPVFIARTGEALSGNMGGAGALGCCIKNGVYYMFSKDNKGYYKSVDGGATWTHEEYETAPASNPWGCYVLSNGRMIMGSDVNDHKVYYSDDDGKNWTTVQSEHFNEPTFIDFGGGTVMAICRENKDSNNNLQPPWMHVSYDNGENWTASVAMTTVGYMGNNNCNAYVHDNYVELFVGCRNWSASPQWDENMYKINQYVLDLGKGPVDEFEFVNTVYYFKGDDNPQGITTTFNCADDFSTPVIAIKDKSHSLMMFYAPQGRYVTHHLVALGNVPVDDFSIPKPMPESFTASQTFTGNSEEITVCDAYGISSYYNGYPQVNAGKYLLIDDIENGGYIHAQTAYNYANHGWELPLLACVKDLTIFSYTTSGYMNCSPLPAGATTLPLHPGIINDVHLYKTDGSIVDIYARFKDNAWWLFYGGSWLRFYTSDSGVAIPEGATNKGADNRIYEPYTLGGLTSYIAFGLNAHTKQYALYKFEYDKASV